MLRSYNTFPTKHADAQMIHKIDSTLNKEELIPWTSNDVLTHNYRFYLNMRPSTTQQQKQPAFNRLGDLQNFINQLSSRLVQHQSDRSLIDHPMTASLTMIGCTIDPIQRLRNHRLAEKRSSWLMHLIRAVFQVAYPDQFELDQSVIYCCFKRHQVNYAESVFARLTESYALTGTGFNISTAGLNDIDQFFDQYDWDVWAEEALELVTSQQSKRLLD